MGSYVTFSSGISKSHLNLFTMLCMNTSICGLEYSFPMQTLPPPPNGTKVYGAGPAPSYLEGSNSSGFGK